MLTEILEDRKREKAKLDREAKLGFSLGLLLRYAWSGTVWVLLMLAVGVAVVVYGVIRILFGSMGR